MVNGTGKMDLHLHEFVLPVLSPFFCKVTAISCVLNKERLLQLLTQHWLSYSVFITPPPVIARFLSFPLKRDNEYRKPCIPGIIIHSFLCSLATEMISYSCIELWHKHNGRVSTQQDFH